MANQRSKCSILRLIEEHNNKNKRSTLYTLLYNFTNLQLFFVRCTDIYLKECGKIAFVLPRGVFASDQHNKFRENTFAHKIGYWLLFDLEKNQRERVNPLFSVESCVVFGEKRKAT